MEDVKKEIKEKDSIFPHLHKLNKLGQIEHFPLTQ